MIKICLYCNNEFIAKNKNKKFCSSVCVNINTSIFQKEYKNRPEIRKLNSDAQKIALNKPETKRKMSDSQKIVANDPIRKEMFSKWSKEFHNREDTKLKTSEWTKKYFNENPEARGKIAKSTKKYYSEVYPTDDRARLKRSEAAKKVMENPKVRKSMGDRSRNMWADPKNASRIINARHKYKEYTLPSGKIVKLQGYEPFVLDRLLEIYNESDIFIGVSEIYSQIGRIHYNFENMERTYYPDFYIKSINKIMEVKSEYTFGIKKYENIAKQNSCLNLGFSFEFNIVDRNGIRRN